MKFVKKSVWLLAAGVVASCQFPQGIDTPFAPRPFQMGDLPQGEDAYSTGFRAGCNNGIAYNGFAANRLHGEPNLTFDVKMRLTSKEYAMGYKDGSKHCITFVNASTNV